MYGWGKKTNLAPKMVFFLEKEKLLRDNKKMAALRSIMKMSLGVFVSPLSSSCLSCFSLRPCEVFLGEFCRFAAISRSASIFGFKEIWFQFRVNDSLQNWRNTLRHRNILLGLAV
jgi:hypothetical protein